MLLQSNMSFWFRANQSLCLLLNAGYLAEKQQQTINFSLWLERTWPQIHHLDLASNPPSWPGLKSTILTWPQTHHLDLASNPPSWPGLKPTILTWPQTHHLDLVSNPPSCTWGKHAKDYTNVYLFLISINHDIVFILSRYHGNSVKCIYCFMQIITNNWAIYK